MKIGTLVRIRIDDIHWVDGVYVVQDPTCFARLYYYGERSIYTIWLFDNSKRVVLRRDKPDVEPANRL